MILIPDRGRVNLDRQNQGLAINGVNHFTWWCIKGDPGYYEVVVVTGVSACDSALSGSRKGLVVIVVLDRTEDESSHLSLPQSYHLQSTLNTLVSSWQ